DEPSLVGLLAELRTVRAGLAHLASHPPAPGGQARWLTRFRELEKEKDDIQGKLAERSLRFRRQSFVGPEVVAKAVPAGAALLDFLEHTHPGRAKKGVGAGDRRLLPLVVRRGREVSCVDLGSVQRTRRATDAWRKPVQSAPAGTIDHQAAADIRKRVWLPL